jgi:hypothetical protein
VKDVQRERTIASVGLKKYTLLGFWIMNDIDMFVVFSTSFRSKLKRKEAIFSREQLYENARKSKADSYPCKDASGRLLNESFCVPFILTSMGGLCREGHDLLRLYKKRNKSATLRLLDVLIAQHAKWTARRIRRALFGQSLVNFLLLVLSFSPLSLVVTYGELTVFPKAAPHRGLCCMN